MRLLPLLLVGCALSGDGPATPGSASAEHAAKAAALARAAAEVESLSAEIESDIDAARRRVAAGESTQEAEVAAIREKVARLQVLNSNLGTEVDRWEAELSRLAGDRLGALPPEQGAGVDKVRGEFGTGLEQPAPK